MLHWVQVLGEEIPEMMWQTTWSQAAKSSFCKLYKENAYKILYFWYLTPDILHVIYPSSLDRCWRYQGDKKYPIPYLLELPHDSALLAYDAALTGLPY